MNLGNSILIKFLMVLFSLEGSVSMNDKIQSHIGNQIILSGPKHPTRPYRLTWTKNSKVIAKYEDHSIIIPESDKYHLFLNGSLKINKLERMDAGNYEVKAFDESVKHLFSGLITLQVNGSVSMNDKIQSHIGNQIILSGPKHPTRPYRLTWTKNSKVIAKYEDHSIIIPESDKYHLFLNGSLKINKLERMDAGNYEVKAFDESVKHLFSGLITLQVNELLPKLNELCPQRTLTCEVKSSEELKPNFKLFQDTKEIEMFEQPVYENATWKVTLKLKVLSGKFRCEIDVNSGKNHTEKQITCSREGLMFLILIITGSVVTSIIFLALIIYCIRRKKAKRREREAAEQYALKIQVENHMQQRKLPEIPVSSGSNPPPQKSRLPPSKLQQQTGPSKSCPHPKPPRRIKEIA